LELKLFGKTIFEVKNSTSYIPKLYDDPAWQKYLQGNGYSVSRDTALKIAVVIRCVDVVAKSMASLGCHLFKDTTIGKERAKNHRLYNLLRNMPNPETTAYEFWHMYIFNLMLTDGAYAKIVRDQNGFIQQVWNIPSSHVRRDRDKRTGERFIDVSMLDCKIERLYEGQFMYTPGVRFSDCDDPEDFIRIAREVLGLTMNLNNFAKDYFENGSNPGGFIEYPNSIDDGAFAKFKDDWAKTYSGVTSQHKWAILEGGFKINKMESNPEQAQALESRKFQVIEVCRIMGVTPHKVFSLEGVNYNSIEQLNIEYVQETIDPMDERICQTIYKDLLSTKEQKEYFARFNVNKLLKGDTKARTDYYNSMRQNGVLSTNDIRDLEDMNRLTDDQGGNEYLVNGNMISLANAKGNLPKSMQKGGNGQ
jgi:HK97 family phage portal protein